MKFTVFGGSGFVGSALSAYLARQGHEVFIPVRNGEDAIGQYLGHAVYAIGMTANFRGRPFETVDAHVGLLAHLLRNTRFDSWLYLSSTRVYGRVGGGQPVREDTPIPVTPDADSLYDISKLMGEALCLAQPSPQVRVARLANVYGPGQSRHTFLAAVIAELSAAGHVEIMESPVSAKDYVALSDVIALAEKIALSGRERVYNVASGARVTHAELAAKLSALTGGGIRFAGDAPTRIFPEIDIGRIASEFGHIPAQLLDNLGDLLPASRINPT
ncbi:MAG: NAD-dependent epimerase/dehydratase family protein [Candidatus Methylumidiphilus sp.]